MAPHLLEPTEDRAHVGVVEVRGDGLFRGRVERDDKGVHLGQSARENRPHRLFAGLLLGEGRERQIALEGRQEILHAGSRTRRGGDRTPLRTVPVEDRPRSRAQRLQLFVVAMENHIGTRP